MDVQGCVGFYGGIEGVEVSASKDQTPQRAHSNDNADYIQYPGGHMSYSLSSFKGVL